MTTLTSRSLPLLSLPLNVLVSNNETIMHQESLMMSNHGLLTSPRIVQDTTNKIECHTSPSGFDLNQRNLDTNEMRTNSILEESSEPRSSSVSSYQTESVNNNKTIDDDDDRISCASDDSELSVGKEDESATVSGGGGGGTINKLNVNKDDDMSNDSLQSVIPRSFLPTGGSGGDQIRFPIVRPSPTRLQEEIIRNSQLYAEELMKQQMNFMAVTRRLSLNPKENLYNFPLRPDVLNPLRPNDDPKIGFRPHIKPNDTKEQRWLSMDEPNSPEPMNFHGIHSHLSAISKITSALQHDMQKLTTPNLLSRDSSQSPLNENHLHLMNNNLNEANLKFSIDNILKADFGRRITDPLLKRSKSSGTRKHRTTGSAKGKLSSAMDLTATTSNASNDVSSVVSSTASAMLSPGSTNGSTSGQEKLSPVSTSSTTGATKSDGSSESGGPMVWPAWVYCTRYSDRPSSGRSPRTRRPKKPPSEKGNVTPDEKRPRTAFSGPQLARLKHEFAENRYLTERRRQQLSAELGLNEAQIKIWFQNKRAKIKKSSGQKNPLALQLMAQGLYNHSTVPLTREEEELQELQAQAANGCE